MNKQKDVRKHIAAAKGWLTQADDSLEQENDIQGDLKLMLAHAELQRAQEKNDRKICVRWFKRLMPPIVACLLALAGIIYSKDSKTEPVHEAPVADRQTGQAEQQEAYSALSKADSSVSDKVQAEEPAIEPQIEKQNVEIQEENNEENNNYDVPVWQQKKPEVPDREIQQLMQSAGSILRE